MKRVDRVRLSSAVRDARAASPRRAAPSGRRSSASRTGCSRSAATARPASSATAARDAKRWFAAAHEPDERLVRRGAWHVHVGVALSVCAVAGMGLAAASVASDARLPTVVVRWAGALVWQLLVSTGILASSRAGRLIALAPGALALAGTMLLVGLLFTPGLHVTVFRGSQLAFAACLAAYAVGTGLATLTPAANAWHDGREAMRAVKRRAKSLAEWRRGPTTNGRDALHSSYSFRRLSTPCQGPTSK